MRFHADVFEMADSTIFELWVRHCDTGWYDSTWAAEAKVALVCFGNEGFGSWALADTWGATPTVPSDVQFPVPAGAAADVQAFCALASMEGNGDVDTGGRCTASLANGFVRGHLEEGCGEDGKEYGESWTIVLGLPDDVSLTRVAFDAAGGGRGRDPVTLFHGSFESRCVDLGHGVECELLAYGSIRAWRGEVLFLDGTFPDAAAAP